MINVRWDTLEAKINKLKGRKCLTKSESEGKKTEWKKYINRYQWSVKQLQAVEYGISGFP